MNHISRSVVPLHRDVHHDRQSWYYTALWQYGEERLKVEIRCDCSYRFQSDFRIFIWSRPKMEWSLLADIHYSQAKSLPNAFIGDQVTAAAFGQDEEDLLDRALMVIAAHPDQPVAKDRHARSAAGRKPSPLPPNPDGMNFDRAAWADKAIDAFREATGTDLEDALGDLLADLMHWADRAGYDYDAALDRARGHYEAETASL
jgi:hypothetical protein